MRIIRSLMPIVNTLIRIISTLMRIIRTLMPIINMLTRGIPDALKQVNGLAHDLQARSRVQHFTHGVAFRLVRTKCCGSRKLAASWADDSRASAVSALYAELPQNWFCCSRAASRSCCHAGQQL